MLILYYPPFRADDDPELEYQTVIALQDYLDDLAEFPRNVLAEAWRTVRRAHKTERWPTIQVIRDACVACQTPRGGSGGGSNRTVEAIQAQREAEYRQTGVWCDAWGPRPTDDEAERRKHATWMRAFERGASPALTAACDVTLARLRDGESAVAILQQTMGAGNAIPLHPSERMSRTSADYRRAESLRRAEEH